MGISIYGYSNVIIRVAKQSDLDNEELFDDEEYIVYDSKRNLIIKKSEDTQFIDGSRSYSGCGQWSRVLHKYANIKGIKFFMVPIECEGTVISNNDTEKTEKFLEEVYNSLIEEDETELEKIYGIDGWDVEFTGLIHKAFKLCNDGGVIVYL